MRLDNFCLYFIQVSINVPVYLCHQFHYKFICFTPEDKATTTTVGSNISTGSKPNAFVIMMSTAYKIVLPPSYQSSGEQRLRGDHAVYNKLLNILKGMKLGWNSATVGITGKKFVKELADCLCALDPHHEQFVWIY